MKNIHFKIQAILMLLAFGLVMTSLLAQEYSFFWLYWLLFTGCIQGLGTLIINFRYGFRHEGFRNHLLISIAYLILGYMSLEYFGKGDERQVVLIILMLPAIALAGYYTWCSYRLTNPVKKGWLDI